LPEIGSKDNLRGIKKTADKQAVIIVDITEED